MVNEGIPLDCHNSDLPAIMADTDDCDTLDRVALDRARHFFQLCDWEKKGFVIKSDMKRLRTNLPDLSEEQLEQVFERLDRSGDKRLTVEEFVHGFAEFLSLRLSLMPPQVEPGNLHEELALMEGEHICTGFRRLSTFDEQFEEFIEKTGGEDVFQDQTAIRALWTKLRKDKPELLINFEIFLQQVAEEIQQKKDDFTSLENIFKQRVSSRDEEVQLLYEEMESQIRVEKERVMAEEKRKAEKLQEELQRQIAEKDREMEELSTRHSQMEKKLENLEGDHVQTEYEKEQLLKERAAFLREKEEMERELESARKAIQAQKKELVKLRQRDTMDPLAGVACEWEREELVKELETLRRANRKVIDERDEIRSLQEPAFPPPIRRYEGYANSPTLSSNRRGRHSQRAWDYVNSSPVPALDLDDQDDSLIVDEDEYEEDLLPKCFLNPQSQYYDANEVSLMSELGEALKGDSAWNDVSSERIGPLGGNEKVESSNGLMQWREHQPMALDRIFKVVFLGDSGVGKTCFVQRFCYNRFRPTFSATIGVDFQVKSITVDGRTTALQLWDTAGQERYRSITKQYFRKSDGVVLMYDVTSELSFLNLRNWLQCVKEGIEDDCVLCLIGNKIDLCPTEESRVVRFIDGQRLAEQCGALFFEASAQTGIGVNNSMQSLSVLLRDREDKHLEKVLRLEMEVQEQRKGCCSGGNRVQ